MVVKVVVIGIVLVFAILVILTLLLTLFRKAAGGKSEERNEKQPQTLRTVPEKAPASTGQACEEDALSLICVLTAAVAAYRSEMGENADPGRFRVVAFRKTPRRIR